jgi:glucokinase
MTVLGIDLGGTKLALAVFSEQGSLVREETAMLAGRTGSDVGAIICEHVSKFLTEQKAGDEICSIGACVPGISYRDTGRVWAPNIPGWDDYPLRDELQRVVKGIPVSVDSDRACYILGESWKGNAKGCRDAIYLAVGTGIGAGILVDGKVLRGAHDIAGAVGWMALDRPFSEKYAESGCFESQASGEGIAKLAREILSTTQNYDGVLKGIPPGEITASDIFEAYNNGDSIAADVVHRCIELCGMAVANLVSIFDPEKIILGGGVFGPAVRFIPEIRAEAAKWAQPISMKRVSVEPSALGNRAGLYGAGLLAMQQDFPE